MIQRIIDQHRSYKDTKRIAPYSPAFAAELEKRDWSEDRIYRRDGIGAKLLDCENLAAELSGRDYSAENIGNSLGGNMCGCSRKVLRWILRRGKEEHYDQNEMLQES